MSFRFNFLLIFTLLLFAFSCELKQKTTETSDSDIVADTANSELGLLLDIKEIEASHDPRKRITDEINEAIKKLDSKVKYSEPVEVYSISEYVKPELIDSIWTLIEESRFDKLYRLMTEFKTKHGLSKSEFTNYMQEIEKVYGKLNEYSPEKYSVRDLLDSNEIMVYGTYDVTYDKINGKMILNFKVIDSQSIELYDINVKPEDYTAINRFDQLSKQTFQYLAAKEYKKIYESSSEIFRKYTSKNQYYQYMKRFDSVDFIQYKLFQNRISTTLNRLRYDLIYEIDQGKGLLTLIFSESNNEFLLDGIIYESKL